MANQLSFPKNNHIMKVQIILLLALTLMSCDNKPSKVKKSISSVVIKDIYNDSAISIRAIELLNDKSLAFAANNGVFGLYDPKSESWMTSIQTYDSLNPHFRAVAHTSTDFFMLSVESPTLLYKTGAAGQMELVYKEEGEKVFYDAMTFWNDQEGIAIGDQVDGCLSVIMTRDGGQSWEKLPCDKLLKSEKGEGAFAASNTNIAVFGENTWIATGGKVSRIWYSPDKGKSWDIFDTPMINGMETTGIYSLDFYDDNNGFAFGGDYTAPKNNIANKIITNDGGRTWTVVSDGKSPGYRSCVQYVPDSNAHSLVTVGFEGIDYSSDMGKTWEHLSDESFYTIRFLNDSTAYAAGKGRISQLRFQ